MMGDRRRISGFFLSGILILIGLLIILFINHYPVSASTESALRSELTNLRTRITYLEREVRRLGQNQNRPNSVSPNFPPRSGPEIVDGEIIGASDPLFERLSILVIELKESVNDLEKRIDTIEQKIGI